MCFKYNNSFNLHNNQIREYCYCPHFTDEVSEFKRNNLQITQLESLTINSSGTFYSLKHYQNTVIKISVALKKKVWVCVLVIGRVYLFQRMNTNGRVNILLHSLAIQKINFCFLYLNINPESQFIFAIVNQHIDGVERYIYSFIKFLLFSTNSPKMKIFGDTTADILTCVCPNNLCIKIFLKI